MGSFQVLVTGTVHGPFTHPMRIGGIIPDKTGEEFLRSADKRASAKSGRIRPGGPH